MIKFSKLMGKLQERELSKGEFSDSIGIHANTMSALSMNRSVNTSTIDKICEFFQCQPGDIMEWVPNDPIPEKNIKREIEILEAQIKALRERLE